MYFNEDGAQGLFVEGYDQDDLEVMQGRQIYYRGRATALQSEGAPDSTQNEAQDILSQIKARIWVQPLPRLWPNILKKS